MIEVSCAILINEEEKVLVAQRSEAMSLPLKWEFPGGKVEPGETPGEALVREIDEELGLHIGILRQLKSSVHSYPDKEICLIPFICTVVSGEICLKEHAACQWLDISRLKELDWAEADIPVVAQLLLEKRS